MAVLWQKYYAGQYFEVRSAGATRRLYTDGVFHSQYNPKRPVTGSVWDLLMIPAFFQPPGAIRRVLVLGVGGGTVIRQLTEVLTPIQITGIELSKIHLYVAKRFFQVDQQVAKLVHADAVDWVKNYSGPAFDLIIDDLFGGTEGCAQRSVVADVVWFKHLLRNLTDTGLIVTNFGDQAEFRQCGCLQNHVISKKFAKVFTLTKSGYENVVGVFSRSEVSTAALRTNLQRTPKLNPNQKSSKLQYCIRTIKRG